MISSFPFHCLLYFFMSLAIQAPPNSSLLTSYVSWPSTIFSHLLIHCSTTFLHVLSLVLLISSTTFFFLLHYSLDYFMDSRPSYINPQNTPCIPWLNLSRNIPHLCCSPCLYKSLPYLRRALCSLSWNLDPCQEVLMQVPIIRSPVWLESLTLLGLCLFLPGSSVTDLVMGYRFYPSAGVSWGHVPSAHRCYAHVFPCLLPLSVTCTQLGAWCGLISHPWHTILVSFCLVSCMFAFSFRCTYQLLNC